MNIKQLIRKSLYFWRYPRDIIYSLIYIGAWSPTWKLYKLPIIKINKKANLKIGTNLILCSDPKKNSIGVFQKVTIKAVIPKAEIIIGDNVGMSGVSISCFSKISIGNNVLIGSGALITDNDAHAIHPSFRSDPNKIQFAPILIGDNVFIGARSIILKGISIGEGALIGAGSVVTKNVESYSIVAGNPAKVIGDVRDEKHQII